jgi:hypothetical protein
MTSAALTKRAATLPALTRREFARRIFWTTHPICDLCAIAHGSWIQSAQGFAFDRKGGFSLRELLAFIETLPTDAYLRLSRVATSYAPPAATVQPFPVGAGTNREDFSA